MVRTTTLIIILLVTPLLRGFAFDHTIERVVIPIAGYQQTELDFKIELLHDLDFEHIYLDCQSFLNGIDFYQYNEESSSLVQVDFFHLWPDECMQGMEMAIVQDLQCIILTRDRDKGEHSFEFVKDEMECK
ncbi:MAG: hypothetical protein HN353_08470 [Bdellovibrionales bacterium]|jgi:hypothetical protein|nr:hypothetical protein [Bdellovibrionales bacterium]MBT3526856.1 hypothetical protein [Bdellovibrionales bacterium]